MKSVFLDTNVLVYAIDPRDPGKRGAALDIIRGLSGGWSLSVQVLQEFYWTSVRKLSISPSDARTATELWSRQRVVQPSPQLVLGAIDTSERYRISFWDALIVEAAVAGQCDFLYTEDLANGQVIRGVTVMNPF